MLVAAAVALAAAVAAPLLFSIGTLAGTGGIGAELWIQRFLEPLPECAALAAVVLTRVPWVGFAIASFAEVVGAVFGVVTFVAGADFQPSMVELTSWVLAAALTSLPLLGADFLARRLRRFTLATGAIAGAVVGLASAVLLVAPGLVLNRGWFGFDLAAYVESWGVPFFALVLTGLVAAAVAPRLDLPQETAGRG